MSFSSNFIESTVSLKRYEDWKSQNQIFLIKPYYFLSSFPRSANGWVRLVLAAILLRSRGINVQAMKIVKKTKNNGVKYDCLQSENQNFDIEDILPDMYLMNPEQHYQNISNDVKSLQLKITIVKTHHIINCASDKTVFLFREPLPCLTSASLLLNAEGIKESPSSINETIAYLSKFYNAMLEHYLTEKYRNPDNCFFLSNETLAHGNSILEYERLTKFLGYEVKKELIEEVLKTFPLKSGYDKNIRNHITNEAEQMTKKNVYENYQKALQISKEQ